VFFTIAAVAIAAHSPRVEPACQRSARDDRERIAAMAAALVISRASGARTCLRESVSS